MANEWKICEGIILRVTAFRDYDQILTLFTKDQGILKLLHKGTKKKQRLHTVFMPLTKVEAIYKEKSVELFACEEVNLIQPYLALRENWNCLQAACDCLHALYISQWAGRAATALYHLLTYYLDKLPAVLDPWVLAISFRLKILHYEGLLAFQPQYGDLYFNEDELKLLEHLTLCRQYSLLAQLTLPPGFRAKIKALFADQIEK